jgi:RimJ/RimL family protein N-acetyltransferase
MGVDGAVRLVGRRLVLRDFRAGDLDSVHSYACDPTVTRFLDWGPNSLEDTRAFLAQAVAQASAAPRHCFDAAVIDAESGALIGGASLRITSREHRRGELGYALHPAFWSKGYATEAARMLLDFGFCRLHLRRISATCHPDNHGSSNVLRKVGLEFEGRLRSHLRVRGEWRDSLLYARIAEDHGHHVRPI